MKRIQKQTALALLLVFLSAEVIGCGVAKKAISTTGTTFKIVGKAVGKAGKATGKAVGKAGKKIWEKTTETQKKKKEKNKPPKPLPEKPKTSFPASQPVLI